MSEIKSAYEKAMERFQDVKPNPTSLRKKESIDRGKLLCARALEEDIDLTQEISNTAEEERVWLRDGIGETLLTQISIPSSEAFMAKIDVITKIAMSLSPNPAVVEQLLKQYRELCQKYMEEQTHISEQMQTQFAQLQQQTGGNQEQLEALQSKFIQAVQEKIKELNDQFQPAILKVRANLRQLCGFALEK